MFIYLLLLSNIHLIFSNIETLHFESACIEQTNFLHLKLQCSPYEHIQIIRIIYGYSKQTLTSCQFSIYDCIQEGTSENILSCNNQQICTINLTKNDILSTARKTQGVPNCPDFNYIQVNYACIPDSKDICDSWKDEGPIIHLSHTFSKNRQYNYCHCKVRSSMPNGQVLLHAREINRQNENFNMKNSEIDCKKTTYLEIATDRFERKCMDMVPSNTNALFGSGSHNFTLTYVKNDRFSELFFYFELKASPIKKDHHVQIICNWKRRQTTTIPLPPPIIVTKTTTMEPLSTTDIISTTIPITRKRKPTTISMQRGGKLSRLDLIRHRPITRHIEDTTSVSENEGEEEEEEQQQGTNEDQEEVIEEEEVVEGEGEEQEKEQEEEVVTTTIPKKTKKKPRTKQTIVTTTEALKTSTISDNDDEEWLRILSLANIDRELESKHIFSINNRTFVTAVQPSLLNSDEKFHHLTSTSNILLIILVIILCLTFIILIIYCLKIKRPNFIQRLKLNFNIAFLFCCEAGKLLFCSTQQQHQARSISNTPTSIRDKNYRPSSSMPDYQSSVYYMDETGNNHNCRTTQSIYDGGGGKSIYSIDYDEEETEYTTKYDRHQDCGSC